MWDFSLSNVQACNGTANAPRMRYVPLGFLDDTPRMNYHNLSRAEKQTDESMLLFLGEVAYGREQCWQQLGELSLAGGETMASRMQTVEYVWNHKSFQSLLEDATRGLPLWLNVHKGCGGEDAAKWHDLKPITWRNPKLLNAGGLIISERCDPADEAEFDGMMSFVDGMEGVRDEFERLRGLHAEQRAQLAWTRREAFRQKFDVPSIFDRAGVTLALGRRGQ